MVIGAGIGGLVCALDLAARGLDVTVVERARTPGGKMREATVGDARIDAGPTVLTLRSVFDEIFAAAGASLDAYVTLRPAELLARHHWGADETLDLFGDIERTADAIGRFADAREAEGYRAFCARARSVYETLERSFIRAPRPTPLSLMRNAGPGGLKGLWRGAPFSTLWDELGRHFRDPRLRQLFGRYATYCGSSPYRAPAILMLVAHVERCGVWFVEGGMQRLAEALARLGTHHGVSFRYSTEAAEILLGEKGVIGVKLSTGEQIAADAIVVNADSAALASGLLGSGAAKQVAAYPPGERSLSAVTWALTAKIPSFPLVHHNVFFSSDYRREFDEIFQQGKLPHSPTVYVCAQDRSDTYGDSAVAAERLLCLVNAPATGDSHFFERLEIEQCENATFATLERCGLHIDRRSMSRQITTPADFHRLFPGTGGALYGRASHGWRASFQRPGARTRIGGLYLAGGSTHPGAGVPMAALSGRLAASSLLMDFASTRSWVPTAMPGGTSMRSATTSYMG